MKKIVSLVLFGENFESARANIFFKKKNGREGGSYYRSVLSVSPVSPHWEPVPRLARDLVLIID